MPNEADKPIPNLTNKTNSPHNLTCVRFFLTALKRDRQRSHRRQEEQDPCKKQ